jgi:hypothetical protein
MPTYTSWRDFEGEDAGNGKLRKYCTLVFGKWLGHWDEISFDMIESRRQCIYSVIREEPGGWEEERDI